jgi:hypothetical protein
MRFLPRLRSTRVGGPSTSMANQQLSSLAAENSKTPRSLYATLTLALPHARDARDPMIRVTKPPRDRRNCIKLTPCAWQMAKFCQKRANESLGRHKRSGCESGPPVTEVFWKEGRKQPSMECFSNKVQGFTLQDCQIWHDRCFGRYGLLGPEI